MIYTMVVVDDEKYSRDSIVNIVDWNSYEIRIVGIASSGEEGEKIITSLRPDIVITDIRMKRMSGIEMIQRLRANGNESFFVIISAYEQFDYAKQAMEIDVVNYLIKPIKKAELMKTIQKIKGEIQRKINYGNFHDLLYSEHQIKEFETNRASLPKADWRGYYIIINSCCISGVEDKIKVFDILKARNNCEYISFVDDGIVFISAEKVENVLGRIENLKSEMGDNRIFVGISNICADYVNLNLQMYQAARYSFYAKTSGEKFFCDIKNGDDREIKKKLNHEAEKIISTIQKCDRIQLSCELCAFKEYIQREQPNPVRIEMLYDKIVNKLNELMENCGISMLDIVESVDEHDFMNKSGNCFRIDILFPLIERIAVKIINRIIEYRQKTENSNIDEIIKYIDEHFTDDITLMLLSKKFYIKQSYLSGLFKKKTGMNYLQYLTEKRIEKAKILLVNTNMAVYEIALETGYSDPKYFSQLFRRLTGETPQKYRNRILGRSGTDTES